LHAGNDEGLQPSARGVDGRCIPSRACTEDQQAGTMQFGQGLGPGNTHGAQDIGKIGEYRNPDALNTRGYARILRLKRRASNERFN
jgi:hypothetical protein